MRKTEDGVCGAAATQLQTARGERGKAGRQERERETQGESEEEGDIQSVQEHREEETERRKALRGAQTMQNGVKKTADQTSLI